MATEAGLGRLAALLKGFPKKCRQRLDFEFRLVNLFVLPALTVRFE